MSQETSIKGQGSGQYSTLSNRLNGQNYDVQTPAQGNTQANYANGESQEQDVRASIHNQKDSPPEYRSATTSQRSQASSNSGNNNMASNMNQSSGAEVPGSIRNPQQFDFAISSDAEKKLDYQKSAAQRENFEYHQGEMQSIQQARSEDVTLTKLYSDQTYDGADTQGDEMRPVQSKNSASEAVSLTDTITNASGPDVWSEPYYNPPAFNSGQFAPLDGRNTEYNINSKNYGGGLLSSLVKLYSIPLDNSPLKSDANSISTSQVPGMLRPKMSTGSCNSRTTDGLSSTVDSRTFSEKSSKNKFHDDENRRGLNKRFSSATLTDMAKTKLSSKQRLDDEVKITVHIAETQSRQYYLLKLCEALMAYGAPTHRLEEYLKMSARVLEVQGSFLYLPGCMIVSFEDNSTRTNEVKLVKTLQGINLGLLVDVHDIYKEVVHDVISIEEATQRLETIIGGKPLYSPWVVTLIYGFASAFVAPWAFQGRYIDMPVCFFLGSIVGFLQHVVAPKSELYNNVFEIAATVITSFLARAFGSIQNGNLFCFSAMAQAALALMLPGYIVLCGALELQSKSMVAGGVRMVYGLIVSFFLGFGISIGTAFYGLLDPNATTATTCQAPLIDHQRWVFVPIFAMFAGMANQAKAKQFPAMMFIGFAGYIVNFLTLKRLSNIQISNTLGAFTVGMLGNFHSRVQHGVAAAALVPALLVLVPSGIAASGSLLAGLSSADKLMDGNANITGTSSVPVTSPEELSKIIFNVGYTMVQIAIGLTIGLFMSTLLIYPFGKRRSGLFAY